jgi:hypothetical protein
MDTLIVNFINPSPQPNTTVGETITVYGTVSASAGSLTGKGLAASVQFGAGAPYVKAAITNFNAWQCTGTVPPNAANGAPLQITVSASAPYVPPGSQDGGGEISGSATLTLILSSPPPSLEADPFPLEIVASTLPFQLNVTGRAGSASVVGHVTSVQYTLNSAAPVAAFNDAAGDWKTWSAQINLPAGKNTLVFTAIDSHSNKSLAESFTVTVEIPYTPTAVDQAFEPTAYLRELLTFASAQVIVPPANTGPTPQFLAQQFFQPFDRLTTDAAYGQATAFVHQARIAIEVLRQQLSASTPPVVVPSDTEQRYRLLAYQTLLRQFGTSYDEMRLARVAGLATRTALAGRIGIQIGPTRPDNLDQITLFATAITNEALETLFGYRSTAPADPLAAPSSPQPSLLLWQLAALRSIWQNEDAQTRDVPAGALPIIDPDLIGAPNFTNPVASNPAFALWTTRQSWVTTTLAQITQDGAAKTAPLALFNQLVSKYIGSIDIADLAATDANGGDISGTLAPLYLDLDAFRFLALCLQLLSAGTLLDSEWQDIFAILLETQKRMQFRQWRSQEIQAGLILEPAQFQPNDAAPTPVIPAWRGSSEIYSEWQRTLEGRIAQSQTLKSNFAAAVATTEDQTLPALRDALLQLIGQQQKPPEALNTTAERLSRQLQIDFLTNAGPRTTRVNQAIDTLQGILFSVRTGRITTGGAAWMLNSSASPAFDDAWLWMSTFEAWLAGIKIFAYPENQLSPNLYLPGTPALSLTTTYFSTLLSQLRSQARFTPADARTAASSYISSLLKDADVDANYSVGDVLNAKDAPPFTDQLTDQQLATRRKNIQDKFAPINVPAAVVTQYPYFEAFWLVPMAIALRLQSDRQYLAALDWFRTVYAYNLPEANRNIYYPLDLEESVTTTYAPYPFWLTTELNPHTVVHTILIGSQTSNVGAQGRRNAYTSYTVLCIVQCLLAFGDMQFSNGTPESISEARTLYETAIDLLQNPPQVASPTDPTVPFPPNPIWPPLLSHAQSNLAKIRNGLNIAGLPMTASSATVYLPSQYPYSVLIARAKNLVGIAQQVESSYLSALEQRDADTYSALQASNDIQVAGASVTLAQLKVNDAVDGVAAAQLQQSKANVEYNYYDTLIGNGLNVYEEAGLASMSLAVLANGLGIFNIQKNILDPGASVASAASAAAQLADTQASYERRAEGWQYQRNLADQDIQIAGQQIVLAQDQQEIAVQEQSVATIQLNNATEVLKFLSNKFTNAELFDWMSGVLGQVYAHFLQQATATAQLAEAQLAFERQTPPSGYIRSDYWQNTADSSDGADRQGLTGAEQLLEDIDQLDEYAFESDVRTLHLTQTLSVAQIGALELQQFRETGVLSFATPMSLFDQDFPGHYLRLIQSVQLSIIALVPPVRGIRGTLSASGISRVVVPTEDQFETVTLGRSPEAFSFTSPTNANGLFDVETDTSGLLLPFQGMGVDAVWQLELPRAANPFDYRTISDVQLTIKYTALDSYDYREEVIRNLDNTFSGDQTFSLRDDFPDAWYLLNNPQTVSDAASQMKVTLTTVREDFQPNIDALAVQQISLYCLRQDGVTQELNLLSLAHTPTGAQTITSTAPVQTIGGIIGTRRPAGTPWLPLVGQNPVGDWTLQFENTDPVRALFANGSIQDVALVLTTSGLTPAWP